MAYQHQAHRFQPKVTSIPTQQEYEKTLAEINKAYQEAQKDLQYWHRNKMVSAQMSKCAGIRGIGECDRWKKLRRDEWTNDLEPKIQSRINDAKTDLETYQTQVAQLQTEKKQAELNAELARQQKIIEDNIKETFRIETEKMQALSDALTKERQAKIIPPPVLPVIQTPKDEPLAILSDMDRLENYVSRKSEPVQESKINYSTIAIIGAIGIVSLLLVRRFA